MSKRWWQRKKKIKLAPGACKPRRSMEDWLTPEQYKDFKKHHYFDVVGSLSGRYRIRVYEYSHNITALNGSLKGFQFCAHVHHRDFVTVLMDIGSGLLMNNHYLQNAIAQKIWIETDERTFREKANISVVR